MSRTRAVLLATGVIGGVTLLVVWSLGRASVATIDPGRMEPEPRSPLRSAPAAAAPRASAPATPGGRSSAAASQPPAVDPRQPLPAPSNAPPREHAEADLTADDALSVFSAGLRQIRAHQRELDQCYREWLALTPGLPSVVELRLRVSPLEDGGSAITDLELSALDAGAEPFFVGCVLNAVSDIRLKGSQRITSIGYRLELDAGT